MYCRSVVVEFMGQCVLVLGWMLLPLCVTQQREQRKTCAHMWVFCRGRALGLYCFQQMGVTGVGKGVCMSVLGACWSVFFLCLSTSELPLHLAASRTSAKMTDHTPLFTHSLSLSLGLSTASIYLLIYHCRLYFSCFCHFLPISFCLTSFLTCFIFCFIFLSAGKKNWTHCNSCTALIPLCCLPIFTRYKDSDMTPVNHPNCVSAFPSTLGSGLQKKTEMVKVKEVLKQIPQVIWLALEICPPSLCYITISLTHVHTPSLHHLYSLSHI